MDKPTFIIDCPYCRAKVAAIEEGNASRIYWYEETGEPEGTKLIIGSCPRCKNLLVGKTDQVDFEGYDAEQDRWSNVVVRVYPNPQKTFLSPRIPRSATESLSEADRSLQANANIAACAMLGRALEAVCRDVLGAKVMLGAGVKMLKTKESLMIGFIIGASNCVHFATLRHTQMMGRFHGRMPKTFNPLSMPLSSMSTISRTDTKNSRHA